MYNSVYLPNETYEQWHERNQRNEAMILPIQAMLGSFFTQLGWEIHPSKPHYSFTRSYTQREEGAKIVEIYNWLPVVQLCNIPIVMYAGKSMHSEFLSFSRHKFAHPYAGVVIFPLHTGGYIFWILSQDPPEPDNYCNNRTIERFERQLKPGKLIYNNFEILDFDAPYLLSDAYILKRLQIWAKQSSM